MYRYRNRKGRCYELSYMIFTTHYEEGMILVHGQLFDNFPHAWIETGEDVYDAVRDVKMPWTEYQKVYRAKRDATYSTQEEAAKACMKDGFTYGPWLDT
jgi:hypothetical protein